MGHQLRTSWRKLNKWLGFFYYWEIPGKPSNRSFIHSSFLRWRNVLVPLESWLQKRLPTLTGAVQVRKHCQVDYKDIQESPNLSIGNVDFAKDIVVLEDTLSVRHPILNLVNNLARKSERRYKRQKQKSSRHFLKSSSVGGCPSTRCWACSLAGKYNPVW